MSETSPRLDLPYLQASQAQKHVTHNEALKRLDTLTQLVVEGFAAETPPAAPAPGEIHALGALPTGVWAGQAGTLAAWDGVVWGFFAPKTGWRAWGRAEAELRVFDGTDWIAVDGGHQGLDGIGIGTSWDAANRLAVASAAALFTHAGAGHQVKVNKAAAADTASLLFQTAFSGRAEMGLAGDDDFAIKVSADGTTWTEALAFDKATGLPSGAAVQSSPADATPGRLLRVGAFGLGSDGTTLTPVISDLDDATAPAGMYAVQTATSGTRPTGASNFATLLVQRQALTGVLQIWTNSNGIAMFYRTSTSGVWGSWQRIYAQNSVLGTVSQSGGVPTGALIERGSNANGEYVRFADGTQICRHQITLAASDTAFGSIYESANTTSWTFPASFASGTRASVNASVTNVGRIFLEKYCASHTSASFRAMRGQSNATAPIVEVEAIGRWF